ncbi:MAG: FecR domain-containing protein, partial [Magnetococcales bacterium]|nr:FecR domain-containing protein [Magnetococcales bacterium]
MKRDIGFYQSEPFEVHTYALDPIGTDTLVVPGGDLLLRAEFQRSGDDLTLRGTGDFAGQSIRVPSYFSQVTPPELQTAHGARIPAELVKSLAGPANPGMVAEAEDGSTDTTSIGTIDTLNGKAFIVRGGIKIPATKGMPLKEGDVIETTANGSVGLLYADDTTVSLGNSGRMVIEEMSYDPTAGIGSSSTSVVQGTFSFVSGGVAKLGQSNMVFKTPVAEIGIRGTTVAGSAGAEGTENTFTLLADADGGVGSISVTNDAGTQVLTKPNQTTSVTSFTSPPTKAFVMSAAQVSERYGSTIQMRPATPVKKAADKKDDKGDGEADPEAEGEVEAEAEAEAEGDGEADPEAEAEGEGDPEAEAEGEVDPEAEAEGEGDPEAEAEGEAG